MNTKPTLIIIQGFLGAGKTTFSKKLAKEQNAVRLNADEWCFENFYEKQLEENWEQCFAKAIEDLWQQAEALLKEDQNVILDNAFWDLASRDQAREFAQKAGVSFRHYYLYVPDELLLTRLRKREGPIARSNIENFAKLKERFEAPKPFEKAIRIESYNAEYQSSVLFSCRQL